VDQRNGYDRKDTLSAGSFTSEIAAILQAKIKPQEKTGQLADALRGNPGLIDELIADFSSFKAAEQGTCIEALEWITKDEPQFAAGCLNFIVERLNDKAPRIRMESARVVGNIAVAFPDHLEPAVAKLLRNTKDEGTVVRWSAAYALCEMAKNCPQLRGRLIVQMTGIVERETQSGVRNVYLKGLKALARAERQAGATRKNR
jgi:hypothetical protein